MAEKLTDMQWRWQNLGGMVMLVTETGGAKVVLSASHAPVRAPCIVTRDAGTGFLRAIRADDEVARVIAAAPDLVDALAEMYESACTNATSTPSKAAFIKARAALARAGRRV
jgi:hypothetical protein